MTDDDLPVFYGQQLDPQAIRMAAFPSRDAEAFAAHWAKIRGDESVIVKTVLCGESVAGNVVSWGGSGRRLVGYWIGREFWGQGIATRALAGFLELERTRPLHAHVAKHNVASIRVLEKCGFQVTGDGTGSADPEELLMKLGR